MAPTTFCKSLSIPIICSCSSIAHSNKPGYEPKTSCSVKNGHVGTAFHESSVNLKSSSAQWEKLNGSHKLKRPCFCLVSQGLVRNSSLEPSIIFQTVATKLS